MGQTQAPPALPLFSDWPILGTGRNPAGSPVGLGAHSGWDGCRIGCHCCCGYRGHEPLWRAGFHARNLTWGDLLPDCSKFTEPSGNICFSTAGCGRIFAYLQRPRRSALGPLGSPPQVTRKRGHVYSVPVVLSFQCQLVSHQPCYTFLEKRKFLISNATG